MPRTVSSLLLRACLLFAGGLCAFTATALETVRVGFQQSGGSTEFGQPEIQNFDRQAASSIGFQPNIVRFEVPVNDTLLMGCVNGRADLFQNLKDLFHRELDRKSVV